MVHAASRVSRSPPARGAAVAHAAITASRVYGAIGSLWRLVVLWIARPAVIGAICSTWALEARIADYVVDDRAQVEQGEHGPDRHRELAVPAQSGKLAELTPRELEVLTHVARGHSNAEIAADMYLSEATVETHVSRVLAKLELRDRVQAVVLAEEGLVQPGAIDA